jgi:dihydrofolate reductase
MKFTGIIAMSQNRVIGDKGKLPWHYAEDLKFFKQQTINGHLIMGHNTWKGMGILALKSRITWVMMRKNDYGWTSLIDEPRSAMVNIITDSVQLPPQYNYLVAGGLEIYNLFMPRIDEFFVTYIKKDYEGDTVMPPFEDNFVKSEVIFTSPELEIKKLYERKVPQANS